MPILTFPSLVSRLHTSYGKQTHRFRAAFLAMLAIVLVVTSIQYASKVARPAATGQQSRSAFLRWRAMILDVFAGANIYVGKNEYPNPPVMAIVLRPFAELPPIAGAMTWFYAKVLMAILSAIWSFRLVIRNDGQVVPDGVKAVAILIALPAIIGDLSHNNVNIFILFLIASCLELYRRGRDGASGLVLGFAIACKVTPLLFLAYFGWKRAWRVVASCLVGLALSLAVIPGAVFGWERNAQLLTDWYKLMVERPVLKGEITTEHANQAMPGTVYRLFTSSPSFVAYDKTPQGDIPVPAASHNVADIGRTAAWLVVKVLTLAFAIAVVLLCRLPRTERRGWRFTAECGLLVLGMLLLSERTWKHHAVTLFIPAVALAYAATLELSRRTTRFVTVALVTAAMLMMLPGLCGPRAQDLALVYGTHTAAFLILTAGVCLILSHGLRQESGAIGRVDGSNPT
jgi:alpha-1,2-mannosyltransferase